MGWGCRSRNAAEMGNLDGFGESVKSGRALRDAHLSAIGPREDGAPPADYPAIGPREDGAPKIVVYRGMLVAPGIWRGGRS